MATVVHSSVSLRCGVPQPVWLSVFRVAAVLLFPCAALAGDLGGWKSLGPLGSKGSALSIAIDSGFRTTYVAGRSGVAKIVEGATSIEASNGLTTRWVEALVLDPRAPSVLYAGTNGGGIFKSIDGATSWIHLEGSPSVVQALAIAPVTPSTLYAGTAGEGVFKTTDGGGTWTAMTGLTVRTVSAIAIDPRASGTVYVGGQQDYASPKGLAKTTDGGVTWKPVDLGPASTSVVSLAVDPSSSSTVYVTQIAGFPIGVTPTVMRSTNAGQSWVSIADTLPNVQPTALAVDPTSPMTVYLGATRAIFKSVNGGTSWMPLTSGLTPVDDGVLSYVYAIAVDSRSSTLYAGTDGNGLFATGDMGATWRRTSQVFSNLNIDALAIDPSAPLTVYAAAAAGDSADGGIFKSTDGGLSWVERNGGISNRNISVNAIVVDPSAPSTVYLASDGSGVLKTLDGGLSWAEANSGIPPDQYGQYAFSLAIDPSFHLTLYARTATGLFRSADGAATWSPMSTPSPYVSLVAAVPGRTPSTLYAGGLGFLYRSFDGGQNWIPVVTGLTGLITSIVADGISRHTLYATAQQVYYPPHIFLPPTINGVARSDDDGATWHLVNGGLRTTSVSANAFAIDPRTSRRIFVATNDGIYASTNGGEGWFPIDDGLLNVFSSARATALAVDSAPVPNVYAGTNFGGVFRRSAAVTTPPCVANSTSLCLHGGRFRVEVVWSAVSIRTNGSGQAIPFTADAGGFWFFSPNNLELVVKVVDGSSSNGHFWVFAGALSDVAYEITVTDSVSGVVRSYVHAQGPPASVGDVTAF